MLTNQHRFVARMINCSERVDYKKHMCGICHALGDDYGMVSRLMTNHEIILLNMLTEAQCETLPDAVMRRCPLNPTQHVQTNQTVSSRFAAAIGVMLVNTSVEDDLCDGKGLQLPTRLLKVMLERIAKTAQNTLDDLAFNAQELLSLQHKQTEAEANQGNPLAPSMQSSATIFAMTGNLANQPQNQPALATIGANYGAYLYLLDAVKDYAEDYHSGQYNPLSHYAQSTPQQLSLSQNGVEWLKVQFHEIYNNIQRSLASINLYHYQETIQTMLTRPIAQMIEQLESIQDGIHYAVTTSRDIWNTLLLISDGQTKGQSVTTFFNRGDDKSKKRSQKKDRKNDCSGSSCGSCDGNDMFSLLWCSSDMSHCIDLDCDGVPNCMDTNAGCTGVDGCNGFDGCDGFDCN